jgi:hypothetical protein
MAGQAPGRTTIIGLADSGFKARLGDPVALSLAVATPHLFDGETGERLE